MSETVIPRWPWRRREEARALTRAKVPQAFRPAGGEGAPGGMSPREALHVATVWACVRLLAGTASTLPLKVYRPGHDRVSAESSTFARLLARPWDGATASTLVAELVASLVLSGEAFVAVWQDEAGGQALGLLDPAAMQVRREGAALIYLWASPNGQVPLTSADVLHVPGPVRLPGSLRSVSPLAFLGPVLAEARALEISGSAYAKQAARQGAKVRLADGAANDEEARETIREELERRFSGAGSGRPVVAGGIESIDLLQLDLVSAAFLGHRDTSAQSICRALGVPPSMLGLPSGDSLTYATAESRNADYLRYAIEPLLVPIEQALTGWTLARGVTVEFDRRALLRPTSLERAQVYAAAIQGGWMTRDEVRAAESLPPLPQPAPAAQAVAHV